MLKGEIIQPGEPVAVEWRNFRRYVRNVRRQELMLIEFEMSEEDWTALATLPRDGMGTLVITWTDKGGLYEADDMSADEPVPAKKKRAKKESAGPYAVFWHSIQKQGLFNYPAVARAWMKLREHDGEDVKQVLLRLFHVDTRADIAPEALRKWLRSIIYAKDLRAGEADRIKDMLAIAEKRLADAVHSEAKKR